MGDLIEKESKLKRIKTVIKWLIGNGVADNQEKLGQLLGYSNKSSFSQILNGKVRVPSNFTYKLAKLDKRLNEHWISEGWDKMINEKAVTPEAPYLPGTDLIEEQTQTYNDNTHMERIIKAQEKTIAALERENELLRMQLGLGNKQTGT